MKFAGAYVACAIGSGFATGQEILQFFSGHGLASIAGTLVTTVLFSWCGGMFMKHGYEKQLQEPSEIMGFYFGSKLAKFFEILFQLFLYGVYVVMIAGAGATMAEYFGLSPMVGCVAMALVAFVTVILGLTKVTDILGSLGTVLIVFALGIGLYSFLSNMEGLSIVASVLPTLEITKIQGGWFDFDVAIATPDMMGVVGKIGRLLGPKGLMPNPKTGTVTMDVTKAVAEVKAGKIEYRLDKAANVHARIGKASFPVEKLVENYLTLVDTLIKVKPAAAKGQYIKNIAVTSTMSPAVRINILKPLGK